MVVSNQLMLRILKYQSDAVSQFTQVKIIFINVLTMKIDRPGCRLCQTVQVLNQVDFPEPVWPITPINCPSSIVNLHPLTPGSIRSPPAVYIIHFI